MSTKSVYITVFIFILVAALFINVIFEIRSKMFVGIFVAVCMFIFLCTVEFRKMQGQFGGKMAKQFKKMGNLQGKPLHEFVAEVGPYAAHQNVTITDRDNAPGHFYTWRTNIYSIKLLFDENNNCIGVNEEKVIKSK